ncbi:AbiU2 domain-containing protein [Gluconobacter oxydans]|uniref:AbiU2 domain-containing protein n=1 Tax=Gluconobacter oxydans TaxID=442 RepID=UPI000B104C27|nr:hypothetical protein [Gluconobacter oxydans]
MNKTSSQESKKKSLSSMIEICRSELIQFYAIECIFKNITSIDKKMEGSSIEAKYIVQSTALVFQSSLILSVCKIWDTNKSTASLINCDKVFREIKSYIIASRKKITDHFDIIEIEDLMVDYRNNKSKKYKYLEHFFSIRNNFIAHRNKSKNLGIKSIEGQFISENELKVVFLLASDAKKIISKYANILEIEDNIDAISAYNRILTQDFVNNLLQSPKDISGANSVSC